MRIRHPDETPAGVVRQAVDWNRHYVTGDTGWDMGRAAPPFEHLISHPPAWLQGRRLAALGCGRGHDAARFALAGYQVTGLDFAPLALEEARGLYGAVPGLDFAHCDITAPAADLRGTFDLVLEHTCFCALAPQQRPDYVAGVSALLSPGGILFGLWYRFDPPDTEGPPYSLSEARLLELMARGGFDKIHVETPVDSHERRAGRERLCAFRKK
jgi:methyl halide transferase